MGDKLLSIPHFDNFDFQWTVFSKNAPKFWHSIPNQAELLEHFYGHFHRPLALLTQLCSNLQVRSLYRTYSRYVYDVCKYPRKFYFRPPTQNHVWVSWIDFDFQLKSRGPMLRVHNTCRDPIVVKKFEFLCPSAQSVKARHCWSNQTKVFELRLLFGSTQG